MNNRLAKKVRREAKKEARTILGEGITTLGRFIHRRPRWLPKFIWFVPFMAIFKHQAWKELYKNL